MCVVHRWPKLHNHKVYEGEEGGGGRGGVQIHYYLLSLPITPSRLGLFRATARPPACPSSVGSSVYLVRSSVYMCVTVFSVFLSVFRRCVRSTEVTSARETPRTLLRLAGPSSSALRLVLRLPGSRRAHQSWVMATLPTLPTRPPARPTPQLLSNPNFDISRDSALPHYIDNFVSAGQCGTALYRHPC